MTQIQRCIRNVFPERIREMVGFDSYDSRSHPRGGYVFRLWRDGRAVEIHVTLEEFDAKTDLLVLMRDRGQAAWNDALFRHRMAEAIKLEDDLQCPSPI